MSPVEGAEPECEGTRTSGAWPAVQAAGHSGCAHQLASFILGRERNDSVFYNKFFYLKKTTEYCISGHYCSVILRPKVCGNYAAVPRKGRDIAYFEDKSILLLTVSSKNCPKLWIRGNLGIKNDQILPKIVDLFRSD
jgi:hypothetical protein